MQTSVRLFRPPVFNDVIKSNRLRFKFKNDDVTSHRHRQVQAEASRRRRDAAELPAAAVVNLANVPDAADREQLGPDRDRVVVAAASHHVGHGRPAVRQTVVRLRRLRKRVLIAIRGTPAHDYSAFERGARALAPGLDHAVEIVGEAFFGDVEANAAAAHFAALKSPFRGSTSHQVDAVHESAGAKIMEPEAE